MTLFSVVFFSGVVMFLIERIRPGNTLPSTPAWYLRALLFNSIQVGMVFLSTLTLDKWLQATPLWHMPALGLAGDAVVGYLLITFIYYWWHRARHDVPLLWRWLHQLHHSPARLEVVTSFYKHPLEIIINAFLSSAILYSLLGLSPSAASLAVAITGVAELVYHWNIRTPYWLGFIFQRPESHRVHHQYGHHRQNYSDLPLWDMLFGTFHNPRVSPACCGFDIKQEMALSALLSGQRLATPADKENSI